MDSSSSRAPTIERKPLGEGIGRANMQRTSPHSAKVGKATKSPGGHIPHHESLMANGPHTVQDAVSPRNSRLSAITNEDQADSKRNSQVSTASTTVSGKGKRRKTHIGPWQLGVVVGQGGIGKVRKVRHSVTGQEAAVKIIPKAVAERSRAESLANLVESSKKPGAGVLAGVDTIMPFGVEREVVILKLLEHPNIVRLYDVWENRNELYLIMEYVSGGELFGYIEERKRVPEDETVWLFRQVIAALLYCHRLGIHHRDLKPENILVDPENHLVKLADFGMAALQPQGKLLTTPCGSMHYAAPEVFEKSYDGAKADVWSIGIILFVMLTGGTPFAFNPATMTRKVALWHQVLKAGKFDMPPDLSREAQDLLRKMLTVNPKQRISLEAIWNHPFIHKFDASWNETPEDTSVEAWVGPRPLVRGWTVQTYSDIDREILRNLRTMWHSEKEEVLVQRLLSKEANQEKYFYTALQRHREEQLENYLDYGEGMASSGSDYHYIKPGVASVAANIPVIKLPKTASQYSVLQNEHMHSPSVRRQRAPSAASYDPYRTSAGTTTATNPTNAVVVNIVRDTSTNTLKHGGPTSVKRPASLRVEALKNGRRRLSANSSLASLRHSSASVHSRPATMRSMSRHSVASTSTVNSLKAAVVKPTMHRRGVNFQHTRSSVTSTTSPSKGQTPSYNHYDQHLDPHSPSRRSSPVAPMNTKIRSRKETIRANAGPSRLRKSQTQDDVINIEARKVSTELEKFCQEAFFRTSIGSSSHNSATASQAAHDTPPSSISGHMLAGSVNDLDKHINMTSPRRTSGPKPESPSGFIKQELAEIRKRLAARYAQEEGVENAPYKEVLAHLDSLLKEGSPTSSGTEVKRTASTYAHRPSNLPSISEEVRHLDAAVKREAGRSKDSLRVLNHSASGHLDTFRHEHSPPRIAPLVIRKPSGSSSAHEDYKDAARYDSGHLYNKNDSAAPTKLVRKFTPTTAVALKMIAEEASVGDLPSRGIDTVKPVKKVGWFRRRQHFPEETQNIGSQYAFENKAKSSTSESLASKVKHISEMQAAEAAMKDKQHMAMGGFQDKRPGFLWFLRRKRVPQRPPPVLPLEDDVDDIISMASTHALTTSDHGMGSSFLQQHTLDQSEQNDLRDLGVQQNWLSRFLNIKPATKLLCFNTGRGRARQELVRLLRTWRRFGIRDIQLDRARNLIFARLDAANHLGIREVSLVVEMYVILKEGRRAGLSVARFTQRKGAASSFKTLVDGVEGTLRDRGVLVEQGEKWREMEAVFTGGMG